MKALRGPDRNALCQPQPECVLYDEPTTMVDPLMGAIAWRFDLFKAAQDAIESDPGVVGHA